MCVLFGDRMGTNDHGKTLAIPHIPPAINRTIPHTTKGAPKPAVPPTINNAAPPNKPHDASIRKT